MSEEYEISKKTIKSICESSLILEKSLEDLKKKNNRRILKSNKKLLKEISKEYNLDYKKMYNDYIEPKLRDKEIDTLCKSDDLEDNNLNKKKNKSTSKKDKQLLEKLDENPVEKVLSKIEIDGESYWVDDNTDELYTADFMPVGTHKK